MARRDDVSVDIPIWGWITRLTGYGALPHAALRRRHGDYFGDVVDLPPLGEAPLHSRDGPGAREALALS